ncbi:MAG: hypothetical protein AAGC45_05865 [Bacteroidota bacterium]
MGFKKIFREILLVYLSSWILGFGILLFQLYDKDRSFQEATSLIFSQVFPNTTYLLIHHAFFVLLYLIVLGTGYFIQVYKKKGRTIFLKRLGIRFVTPLGMAVLTLKAIILWNSQENYTFNWNPKVMNTLGKVKRHFETDKKHRGMSVFGWRGDTSAAIDDIIKANIEWVAIIPFLYQESERTKVMDIPDPEDGYGRRDSVFIANIRKMRKKGLYVHLKPHLWMSDGWRSNISLDSDEEWDKWFQSYRTNMLHYARMAQLTGAELFCVGTELRTSIKKQPNAWCQLIAEIKAIYNGKLTYAANWYDEYEHITFWDQLDYIGIQAYFPLTEIKNPDLETIKKGWKPHINMLESFSNDYKKPILFTEVGYKSEASATIKPWEWGNALSVLYRRKSDRTQQLAYEALFEGLWHQNWFAGVYIWQWDTRSTQANAATDLDFSPRFKPAENVMAKWFAQAALRPTP